MESFLFFCDAVLIILAVVLTIMDDRRKPGTRSISPFRPDERVVTKVVKPAGTLRAHPSRKALPR